MIKRHRTAIRRNKLSRPVNLMLEQGVLNKEKSFFDYGCGHGEDLQILQKNNFKSTYGYDPFYQPDQEFKQAEVVNLGFVLNVIENPKERQEALRNAFSIAQSVLCVSVMTKAQYRSNGRKFSDGIVSSTGTFQKYYDQAEIKNYIESVLQKDAIAVSPGIFFIFKQEKEKIEYLDNRYRRPVYLEVTRINPETHKKEKVRVFKPKLEEIIKDSPYFNDVLEFVLKHGRLPSVEESQDYQKLIEEFKSKRKIHCLIINNIDEEGLLDIRSRRIEELLVLFALRRFDLGGFPKKKDLPTSTSLDIQEFFGNYKNFLRQSEALLFSLGNESTMREAHKHITIGKVLPDSIYIHPSYVSELPAPIQVKVGVAKKLIGDVEECNLIKINKNKEKVSFLIYEDFEKVAHPALLYSLVVDLPKMSIKLWDFETRDNPPILHRKETFVSESFPSFDKFQKLTRKEESLGLLSRSDIGTRNSWQNILKENKLKIQGHRIIKLKD